MPSLTTSEAAILGLLAEQPRHGYELDELIERRGLREWTEIGFSSIYFLLGKLEQKGCIRQDGAPASAKGRKQYLITDEGRERLDAAALEMIAEVKPRPSPLLVGLANWMRLDRPQALAALRQRRDTIAAQIARLHERWEAQQPLPPFVDRMFAYGVVQAEAELGWLDATIAELEVGDDQARS